MLGHYQGTFKVIASDTGFLPKPEFTITTAEPQLATIVSNTDPKGQGRVQVRFDWQLHDTTDWIRVMTPDAGSSGKVSKNRGFMAIPEVGDQVMIGFQHNHPDRPFVMGGMFHGKVGAGGGVDNRVKSLQTRSGHRLIFTEDESIILTDKSGNEIKLDTEGGNINITAPSSINITAGKSVNINAGEDISISAGMNINTSVTMNYTQMVGINYISTIAGNASHFITGKLMEMIEGDVHSETKKGKTIYNSEGGLETSSLGTIFRFAEKEIRHNSEEKSNNH